MRLLFVTDEETGAFAMRGRQIAERRAGWRATAEPTRAEMARADAVVVVKRGSPALFATTREAGVPLLYDALDFWRQPKARWKPRTRAQRLRSAAEARALFAGYFAARAPDLVICPTQAMADDLAPLGHATAVIRHHADPRLPEAGRYAASARRGGRALLYLGDLAFLRKWRAAIEAAAETLGVAFVAIEAGAADLTAPPPAQAMIAVRGGRHGCWLSRAWKSNVKAATAAQLGLPLAAWPEAAYRETAPEAFWFRDRDSLRRAIEAALEPGAPAVSERFCVDRSAAEFERTAGALLEARR